MNIEQEAESGQDALIGLTCVEIFDVKGLGLRFCLHIGCVVVFFEPLRGLEDLSKLKVILQKD